MQEIIIDFSKYASIADFHDDIAARLNFPAHYGRNLDALNDCIRRTIFYRQRHSESSR